MRQTGRRRRPLLVIVAGLAAALGFALPLPASATNIFVQSTADSGGTCPGATCTLRQAVAVANPAGGDRVKFILPAGSTINLLAPITINKQVDIAGPGSASLTILAAASYAPGAQAFFFDLSADSAISDLTVQGHLDPTFSVSPLVQVSGLLTVVRCVLRNNWTGLSGGAIEMSGGSLVVQDSTFDNNRALQGGGAIDVYDGQALIQHSTFTNNRDPTGGGAIYVDGATNGSLTVTDSTFSGNSSGSQNDPGRGGAIGVSPFHSGPTPNNATITGSTFVGNTNVNGGGALYNGGTLTVTNSTFTQNKAGSGSALYNKSSGTSTLTHVTIAGNLRDTTFSNFGVGIVNETIPSAGTIFIQNSVLAGNEGSVGNFQDASGPMQTLRYNLVQYPAGSSGWDLSFDRLNTNPLLYALGDYGGPTFTMPAAAGGFVIDEIPTFNGCNGALVAVDQRGITRPQSTACDRGAFEKVPGMQSTVTYNSNGGTAIAPQTVPFDTPSTAPPNPIKAGSTFAGWYSDAGLTTLFNFATHITANITLYAKWNVIAAPVLQGKASRKNHGAATYNLPLQ